MQDYVAAYLVSPSEFFFVIPNSSVMSGYAEPQAAQMLTNSSVSGTYAGATTGPENLYVSIFSGEFTADGASPTGTITGTQDIGAPSGPTPGQAANTTYSISSTDPYSPTNGVGSTQGSWPGTMYIISPSKFLVFTSANGSSFSGILVFEK
jgi:hypothetical protein